MTKKHLNQFIQAKAAAQLLHNNLSLITNYDELQDELNKFMRLFLKDTNEKNDRPNKAIIGLINYLNFESKNKRNLENVQKKAKVKRLSPRYKYKDYIEEYIILKNRGYSNQAIANYSYKHFKVKVSKETIRKTLNELQNATQ